MKGEARKRSAALVGEADKQNSQAICRSDYVAVSNTAVTLMMNLHCGIMDKQNPQPKVGDSK